MLVGFTFQSQQFLGPSDEGVRLVRGENVQQGFLRWGEKAMKWRSDAYDDLRKYQLAQGDVILAMDRPIVGGGLKLAWIAEQDLPALLVQRVTRIRGIAEKALTDYLRYVLSSADFVAHVDRITTGANIPHISGKDIADFELRLPPIEEQQKTLECLSPYDDLIETNRRRIALLEESARLLYREWFVDLRFPGHERAKWVDGLPHGWRISKLADLATFNYGKALKESDRRPGSVPVYGSSGIVGTHDAALVDGPVLIVGRKGNVGRVYRSSVGCFAIDTVFFVAGTQVTCYLEQLLKTLNFVSSDAAVPGLNRTYAYGLPVLIPDEAVVRQFESLVLPLQEQMDALTAANRTAADTRDKLLPQLMSGELRV